MTTPLKNNLDAFRNQAIELIRVGAQKKNGIRHRRTYADNYWKLEVTGTGEVYCESYAEDHYGRYTTLDQLNWLDLGALLSELEDKVIR